MAMAAALLSAPATAYADCGDPGPNPCTGPVPTVDQVVAVMAELTDPNRPAASKTDIVTPGFAPDEAQTIDDHLNQMNADGCCPSTSSSPTSNPHPTTSPEPPWRPRDVSSNQRRRAHRARRPRQALADHPRQRNDRVERILVQRRPAVLRVRKSIPY